MSAKNTPESFWARVQIRQPDECWEWQGSRTSSGYGNLSWHGLHVQAHRLAYYLTNRGIKLGTSFRQFGVAKSYRRFVLHQCDNRACCNPAHLFLGSMRANQLDAYRKGRKVQPRSEHTNAKLTADHVREIRSRYVKGGVLQATLAKEYGVSQAVISSVVRRATYKDIQ
jgi:hypothetical protein